ncbi:MAG: hypothetical protein RIB84_23750 [Sneathiellaceae bacterium]
MTAPLLAWKVPDPGLYEDCERIVFAATAQDAAGPLDCNVDQVERAPEFDSHSPGPVPLQAYRAADWQMVCNHCGEMTDAGEWQVVAGEPICRDCIDGADLS